VPSIVWQPLFEDPRAAAVAALAVEGVRLGDPVDALPFARLTAVEPRAEGVHRVWRGGEAFDVAADGSEAAVGRERLDAELRRDGGSAWLERIGFDVADGRVRKIWVRGEGALDGLPIAAEADIARLLGAPTGIERVLGWRVYHYAERGLSVGWDPKHLRVEHVALGPVDWSPPLYDRRDVLWRWLEIPSWEEPAERASSDWVRWARAVALLRAFDLGAPEAFAAGRFLDGKSLDAYPRTAALVAAQWPNPAEAPPTGSLSWMFRWLLSYRSQASLLLHAGWLEASGAALLSAIALTDDANRALAAALEPVDAILFELISPDDRTVEEAELIARFGWPEIDLQALLDAEEGL